MAQGLEFLLSVSVLVDSADKTTHISLNANDHMQ